MTENIISIRDRNLAAYLVALGFQAEFALKKGGMVEIEFKRNDELDAASRAFMANASVPVQSFAAACRYISDRINQIRLAAQK